MAQSQFALSWDAHKKNICAGLSTLQQNGEFVDMTLAADGHHVKVHQVIVALASPYIKEIIASANCSHPIVFLNKISYGTLCLILEYVYTGEVMVSIENLNELIEAGKALHIKGLEDMNLHKSVNTKSTPKQKPVKMDADNLDDEICYFEIADDNDKSFILPDSHMLSNMPRIVTESVVTQSLEDTLDDTMQEEEVLSPDENTIDDKSQVNSQESTNTNDNPSVSMMQYTVSNQGSLQMILNRFVYYLKHTNRNGSRQWRCVDYLGASRCPAHVVTKDDAVIQRVQSHTHPFHDKKILKKVRDGAIFTALQEAELEGQNKRENIPSKHIDTTNNTL